MFDLVDVFLAKQHANELLMAHSTEVHGAEPDEYDPMVIWMHITHDVGVLRGPTWAEPSIIGYVEGGSVCMN